MSATLSPILNLCSILHRATLEFETSKEIGDKRYLFIGDNVRITLKKKNAFHYIGRGLIFVLSSLELLLEHPQG